MAKNNRKWIELNIMIPDLKFGDLNSLEESREGAIQRRKTPLQFIDLQL
jgi:hypothetical protein